MREKKRQAVESALRDFGSEEGFWYAVSGSFSIGT